MCARIRTIKPAHCTDKELPNISLQAHLLWVLNWCFSDDSGVFENDPYLIKSNIFPRRQDIRTEQITQWLDQLQKARFIIPFTHNGVSYYLNRTFNVHQKIDRPQPSSIPKDLIRRIIDEHSTNIRPCNVEYSKVVDGSVAVAEFLNGNPIQGFEELEKLKTKALADQNFTEAFFRLTYLDPSMLSKWLDAFHKWLLFGGEPLKQEKDYRRHFNNWIKNIPYNSTNPEDYSPTTNLSNKKQQVQHSEDAKLTRQRQLLESKK